MPIQGPLKENLAGRITTRVLIPCHSTSSPAFPTWATAGAICPFLKTSTEEVLALPIFPELEPGEQERVVQAISDFYHR